MFDFLFNRYQQRGKNGSMVAKRGLKTWVLALASIIISVGTWNPTGYDFYHHLFALDYTNLFSYVEILFMIVIWLLVYAALKNSVGHLGMGILLLFVVLIIGGSIQQGWINLQELDALGWALNAAFALMIFIGLVAAKVWRTLTGQYVTMDSDEDVDRDDEGGNE